MADDLPAMVGVSTVVSSAKGDNRSSVDRVRCTCKTGRWLASRC